ncbi:MAG: chloride channel protein [Gaiellaceae bacterium]
MSAPAAVPVDPGSLIRSRRYRGLLVLAALVGLLVSLACWVFLEVVHELQHWVFVALPGELGFDGAPTWWPLPVLAVAGLVTAFAIVRLPGHGGHEPSEGLKTGTPTPPVELPGIVLAAVATLGLGLVLGPEAPLIAIGSGLAIFAIRLVKKDSPQPVLTILAAAGSFAAISSIFGSPVIGAVIIIEAAGLGGAMLPVILLPGLLAAGIGSLVFIGMGRWSGLSTSAWALAPLPLPSYSGPDGSDFAWTIVLALVAPVVVFAILELGRLVRRVVAPRPYVLTIAAGLVVAALAMAFHHWTGQSADAVLFSGQEAFGSLFKDAPTVALSTLWLLLLFKGLAWSVSLGSFRGGPTFPALFLGATAGLLAAHLPGFAETQAVAVLMAIATVSVLRLPLSSVVLALLLTSSAGVAVAPLVIVAVVISYITIEVLYERRKGPGEAEIDREIDAATTGAGAAP